MEILKKMMRYVIYFNQCQTYNVVVTVIETISSDKLTVNFVKGRLLDEKIKRLGTSSQIEEQSAAFEVRASK